jgi:hypothetical protein
MAAAISNGLVSLFSSNSSFKGKWQSHLMHGALAGGIAILANVAISGCERAVVANYHLYRETIFKNYTGLKVGMAVGGIMLLSGLISDHFINRKEVNAKKLAIRAVVLPVMGALVGMHLEAAYIQVRALLLQVGELARSWRENGILRTVLSGENAPSALAGGLIAGIYASIGMSRKVANLSFKITDNYSLRVKNLAPIIAGVVGGTVSGNWSYVSGIACAYGLSWILSRSGNAQREELSSKIFCSMFFPALVGGFFQNFYLKTSMIVGAGCLAAKKIKEFAFQKISTREVQGAREVLPIGSLPNARATK